MVRHLRVRTKMLIMLAGPLVALLIFAGMSISTRLDLLSEARTALALTELTQRVDTLLSALQQERRITGTMLEQRGEIDPSRLEEYWEATDTAKRALLPEGLEVPDADLAGDIEGSLEVLQGQLDHLPARRDAIDRGLHTRENAENVYSTLISQGIDVQRLIGAAVASSEVGNDLATLASFSVLIEAGAREELLVGRALERGEFLSLERTQYITQATITQTTESDLLASMREEHHALWNEIVQGSEVSQLAAMRRDALTFPSDAPPPTTVSAFTAASESYRDKLQTASAAVAADVVQRADAAATQARVDAFQAAGISGGVIVIALLLSALVTRQTVEPITRLTTLAQDVSGQQLPMLVDSLRRGGANTTEIRVQPIKVDSKDEVGRLAQAFDEIRAVAVRTATDLSELTRKGISDLFVNLARRNQSLLDRQIGVLDRLEQDEADPEALERLFTLDHLATRMRRNAESLLVLAGAETPRRWTQPVALEEVVRAAIGEVEAYARIQASGIMPRMVSGRAAADLAHLLAELLENATVYSPPASPVMVTSRMSEDGLVVSIRDQGLGMSAESIAEANHLLANPPRAGFGLSRSLGFIVAGLLAQRHGARVRLEGVEGGGTTAEVLIPGMLLTTEGSGELPEIDQKEATEALPEGGQDDEQAAAEVGLPSRDGRRGLGERTQPTARPVARASGSTDRSDESVDMPHSKPRHAAPGPEVHEPASAPRHAAPDPEMEPASAPAGASAQLEPPPAPPSVTSPAAPSAGAESPAWSGPDPEVEAGQANGAWSGNGVAQAHEETTNRSLREMLPRRRGKPQREGQGGSWSVPSPGAPQPGPTGPTRPGPVQPGPAHQGPPHPSPAGREAPPAAPGEGNGGNGWSTPPPGSQSDEGTERKRGALPRRAPGASGRRGEVQAVGPLANEPDVEVQTDTSDILTRYLTGISRKRSDEPGDAVDPPSDGGAQASGPPRSPGRER